MLRVLEVWKRLFLQDIFTDQPAPSRNLVISANHIPRSPSCPPIICTPLHPQILQAEASSLAGGPLDRSRSTPPSVESPTSLKENVESTSEHLSVAIGSIPRLPNVVPSASVLPVGFESSALDADTSAQGTLMPSLGDESYDANSDGIPGTQMINMQNFGSNNQLHVGDIIVGGNAYFEARGGPFSSSFSHPLNVDPALDRSASPSIKHTSVITTVIFIEATRQVLCDLFGNVITSASTEFEEKTGLEEKLVEEHFCRLMESTKSAVERNDPSIRQELRDYMRVLWSELCRIREKLFATTDDPVDVETLSRDIMWQVRLFLFIIHMAGHISSTRIIAMVKKRIAEAQRNAEATTSQQSVKELPYAMAAYDDYVSSNHRRVSCLEGTRQALLDEVGEWVSKSETGIFVLFGLAGMGKSTIAQTVAERADNVQLLGASFFFSRNEAERRTAKMFFTTIAFQLCLHDTEFADAIDKVIRTDAGKRATKKRPLEQLETLILEPLEDLAHRTVVIVIDALDECDESDGPIIIQGLNMLVQRLPSFKVILTTRPQPHLQFLSEDQRSQKLFHLHNIEDKIVDGDLEHYLRHKLSLEQVQACLPNLRNPWTASIDEINLLVRAAGRLFIIASTAVLFILDKTSTPTIRMKVLQMALDQGRMPLNKLNNFYTVILQHAVPKDCEPDTANLYQTVIGTIVLLQQPLPISALAALVNVEVNEITTVLGNLQAVILIGSNDIPIVYHKSFPDYIQDPARCKDEDLRIDTRFHHTRMAIRCLLLLNRHLKQNILDLSDPARFMDNNDALEAQGLSENYVQEKIPLESQYACLYFANHIKSANLGDRELAEGLQQLFNERFTNWLEALSWIGKLDSAHHTLLTLWKRLPTSSEQIPVVADGLRFVWKFNEVIKRSALHTYHSALPFTPTETSLYKRYSKQMSFCQVQGDQKAWDGLVTVLDNGFRLGYVITHIFFSPNSTLFACLMHFSKARRSQIVTHDTLAGTLIGGIGGRVIAIASDFSKTARFANSSITLYNVEGFTPVTAIDPLATVDKLALSPDGSRLLAGLGDGTAGLWDTEKCEQIRSFGRWKRRTEISFSSDGSRAFFASCDGFVELLDGTNGDIVADLPFQESNYWWPPLMFSGDGSRFACLGSSLNVWDSRDGTLIGTAEDIGNSFAMVISTDGSLVATGEEQRLKLWSGNNLALLKTLDLDFSIGSLAIHNDWIGFASSNDDLVAIYDIDSRAFIVRLPIKNPESLAFSPDCTRLVVACRYGVVHLLDLPILIASNITLQRKLSRPTKLAFSPDCSRLASGHDDGTIQLWDTLNMTQVTAHRGHSGPVKLLAYSVDGGKFASGSTDGTIKLWNGKDGVPCDELKCSSELKIVALSSSMLAAMTGPSITLWDPETHAHLGTLDHNQEDTCLMSLSNQHSLLAAVDLTDPFTLTIWDTVQHIPVATFNNLKNIPRGMRFLPNDSLLAVRDNDGFHLFSPHDHRRIEVSENQAISRLGLCPSWHGIPVWIDWPDQTGIFGRFPRLEKAVQVLGFPSGFHRARTAEGPSMIALGHEDGRVLLIKAV